MSRWYWKLEEALLVVRPTVHFHYKKFVKMVLFGLNSPGYMVSALRSFEHNFLQWLPIFLKHDLLLLGLGVVDIG